MQGALGLVGLGALGLAWTAEPVRLRPAAQHLREAMRAPDGRRLNPWA